MLPPGQASAPREHGISCSASWTESGRRRSRTWPDEDRGGKGRKVVSVYFEVMELARHRASEYFSSGLVLAVVCGIMAKISASHPEGDFI